MMPACIPLSEIPREVWDAAPAQPRTPMRQYIWAMAYQETLAHGQVRALVLEPGSSPRALVPFAVSADGPRRQILLGAEDLWESIEVAARDEASLREVAGRIADCGVPLRFGHHPIDTPFLDCLVAAFRGKGRVIIGAKPMRAMPSIALSRPWLEPESQLSARRRSDFRRMARKAEAAGKVTFEIVRPRPENLDPLLDEAFAVEAHGWKGRSGTAISQNARTQAFYRSYARQAMEAGILRLCFLRIDGVAAAMQFAVECDNRFWLIKVGYDEAFGHVSPGNLLMRETIRYAAQAGLESYEFLGKESDWTRLWATDARPIATVRTYPYNLRGLGAFLSDGFGLLIKRIAARLPAKAGG